MKQHEGHNHKEVLEATNSPIVDYFKNFFESSDFMPHGHCYFWRPEVLWTTVVGDLLTSIAYMVIPIMMIVFIRKRTDLKLKGIFYLFAAFIISCGLTHMIDIWTIWTPTYRLQSILKLITGLISIATAIILVPILPKALKVPSPEQFAKEVQEKEEVKKLLAQIERNNSQLKMLYGLIANFSNNFDEDVIHLLKEVTRMLNLKIGIISEVKNNKYVVKYTFHEAGLLTGGETFDIGNTYCDIVLKENKLIHIDSMKDSVYNAHPCYGAFKLESYIGIPLLVNSKTYGTLNFSSDTTRVAFNKSEINLLRLLGGWISTALEREAMKKELGDKKELLDAVLQQSPFGVVVADMKGDIILSNQSGREIIADDNIEGVNKGEMVSKFGVFELDAVTPLKETDLPIVRALNGEQDVRTRLILKRPGFHDITYLDVRAVQLKDLANKPSGAVVLFENINNQVNSEKELRKANEERNLAISNLQKSNKQLEQFGYMISHDLQEPLGTIQSTIEIFELKYNTVLDDKGLQFLSFAKDAATRLKILITDILEYSRFNNSELKKEKINTNELLQNVKADLEQVLTEKNANIEITDLPDIVASKSHLYLLFKNFITNGLKYNESENPLVTIDCTVKESFWQFSISDNGIGIDEKYHDKIFEVFQRLNTRDEYSGTGIGLATCKKIIKDHNGKVWLKSGLNKGTTFYFTLKV